MRPHPIILSPGALSCGCVLAHLLISSRDTPLVVVGERRELPDPEKMLLDVLRDMPKYEIPLPEIELKKSAYERRNLNQPFYTHFQKRRKSKP